LAGAGHDRLNGPHGPVALVAARAGEVDSVVERLWGEDPRPVSVTDRVVGRRRALVYGLFVDEADAARGVAGLRAEGRPATLRPPGAGRLLAWEHATRPVVVGDRLWVCFPWSEFDRGDAPQGAAVVEIDPGAAFGAGSHPSTRLLLAELSQRLAGGEMVLDVGCGSGVLAVSAARLGAAAVRGVDVAPAAVTATAANAAWNDVAERVDVSITPIEEVGGDADIVLANIGAAALVGLAPALWSRLAPGGWLGLSGLSSAQLSGVAAAFPAGCVVAAPRLDEWAALVLTRDR
jgi:ribosomal protein L11 methyltransferase